MRALGGCPPSFSHCTSVPLERIHVQPRGECEQIGRSLKSRVDKKPVRPWSQQPARTERPLALPPPPFHPPPLFAICCCHETNTVFTGSESGISPWPRRQIFNNYRYPPPLTPPSFLRSTPAHSALGPSIHQRSLLAPASPLLNRTEKGRPQLPSTPLTPTLHEA